LNALNKETWILFALLAIDRPTRTVDRPVDWSEGLSKIWTDLLLCWLRSTGLLTATHFSRFASFLSSSFLSNSIDHHLFLKIRQYPNRLFIYVLFTFIFSQNCQNRNISNIDIYPVYTLSLKQRSIHKLWFILSLYINFHYISKSSYSIIHVTKIPNIWRQRFQLDPDFDMSFSNNISLQSWQLPNFNSTSPNSNDPRVFNFLYLIVGSLPSMSSLINLNEIIMAMMCKVFNLKLLYWFQIACGNSIFMVEKLMLSGLPALYRELHVGKGQYLHNQTQWPAAFHLKDQEIQLEVEKHD